MAQISKPTDRSPGFAEHPAYRILFEASPKRVRAIVGGEALADTTRARLMLETGHLPVYYFPREDVQTDRLVRTDHRTRCPYKGEAAHWTVRSGGRVIENAAWAYEAPYREVAGIAGHLAFHWDKIDRWLEEDEEVFGHPRDPHHRIDVRPSAREVRVVLGGETVARTRGALFLFETGLRTRYYIPREDVRTDRLAPSETGSICPYKGTARYWSARIGERAVRDIAWSYPEPLPEMPRIKDRLCFFDERCDAVTVDGQPVAA